MSYQLRLRNDNDPTGSLLRTSQRGALNAARRLLLENNKQGEVIITQRKKKGEKWLRFLVMNYRGSGL